MADVKRKNILNIRVVIVCLVCGICAINTAVASEPIMTADLGLDGSIKEKTEAKEKMEDKKEADEKEKRLATSRAKRKASEDKILAKIQLPEDSTPVFNVSKIQINDSTLLTPEQITKDIPSIYNASEFPIDEADLVDLYDFRTIRDIIEEPGQIRPVSARAIKGFQQYILSIYTDKGYGGVYVYVPSQALVEGKDVKDGLLPIDIIEATISEVGVTYFDVDSNVLEEGYLKESALLDWSPIAPGTPLNKKQLDEFINLLNLSPDRFVSASIARGDQPDTVKANYELYEVSPWHYFIQIDNSGTTDRQWTPRVGMINTSLLGYDDRLTVMVQAPVDDRELAENYSLYGSYDFPICGPKLRLNIFGGKSEFDIDGGGGIDFLGNGWFYGAMLRYNVLQHNNWFLDATTSVTEEKSRVSTLLPGVTIGSTVRLEMLSFGGELYKRDDMSSSMLSISRAHSIGGSDRASFEEARTDADPDFAIWTASASHSRYLDAAKVQRLTGNIRYIRPDERLIPAKMTTFGGMYTVRGYKESSIVADGGILASAQYEYDLVAEAYANEDQVETEAEEEPWLTKLAPLVFVDYGRAKTKNKVPGEAGTEELLSFGPGLAFEVGKNFSGAVYYGTAIRTAGDTDDGNGRLSINLMLKW